MSSNLDRIAIRRGCSNRFFIFFDITMASSSNNNTSSIILDALPYVDVVHEDYESYALALVEQEMKKIKPRPLIKVTQIRSRPQSSILKTELEFIASGQERPTVIGASDVHAPTSMEEWKESIKRARAEYEAERLRSVVLDLEGTYAPDQWKHYTSHTLETLEQQEVSLHTDQQAILEEIHAQRQEEQMEASKTLQQLNQKWHDLIQKRHYLQMATLELEQEIKHIKENVTNGE
jgi:hypothetical protein